MKKAVTLLGIILFLSCGSSSSVTPLTSKAYTPTSPNSVEIFTTTAPDKEYFEIGTVSVIRIKSKMMPINRPAEKVMAEMKEKAASIGGHAIINYRESGEANMTGTIIRYKDTKQ